MKHTCGLLALLILCVMVLAAGCNENKYLPNTPNLKVAADLTDMNAFIREVTEYAHTYEPRLILNDLTISFNELSLNNCTVYLTFAKYDWKSTTTLSITYQAKTKTVTDCEYITDPIEGLPAHPHELDYANLKLDLSKSFVILQRKMKSMHIDTWESIDCDCEDNGYHYYATIKENDESTFLSNASDEPTKVVDIPLILYGEESN